MPPVASPNFSAARCDRPVRPAQSPPPSTPLRQDSPTPLAQKGSPPRIPPPLATVLPCLVSNPFPPARDPSPLLLYMASSVPSSPPATYSVSIAYSLPSQPRTPPASAKSFTCPAFISRDSFSSLPRLITGLSLCWGFRKDAHSLPLWENKDSATVVFRAAQSAGGFFCVGGRYRCDGASENFMVQRNNSPK